MSGVGCPAAASTSPSNTATPKRPGDGARNLATTYRQVAANSRDEHTRSANETEASKHDALGASMDRGDLPPITHVH